jgi:predicted transcriptional regulator
VTNRRGPGELESEVLAALWAVNEPLTPAEVREHVSQALAYTTILTILRRLYEKGYVNREQVPGSRAYAYSPVLDEAEHFADQMHQFLAAGNDRKAVLARFLGRLSAEERRTLTSLMRARRKGR